MATVRRRWDFTMPEARHTVEFEHNTLSGRRVLRVDGTEIYRTGMKYRLTGIIEFPVGPHLARINIEPSDFSSLHYELFINDRAVDPHGEDRIATAWTVPGLSGSSPIAVEFDHDSLEVFVDRYRVESEGDFVDEGSKFNFTLPDGRSASVTSRPRTSRSTLKPGDVKADVELEVAGVLVPADGAGLEGSATEGTAVETLGRGGGGGGGGVGGGGK